MAVARRLVPAAAPTPAPSGPIRVMICDDSAVIRSVLARVLSQDAGVTVVARARDGQDAVSQLRDRANQVDVLVLDIEMPVMDGLTALPKLLAISPGLRVIMASTLTTRGAAVERRATRR